VTARPLLVLALSLALVPGCRSFRDCSAVDASASESLPAQLSETGLYADIAGDVVVDAAIPFAPRFPLWTDGATKRRWLVLPDGGSVDTSDVDAWAFPVGTKFFKEFTRDDVRIETRLNAKTADGWTAASYLWDGDDAARLVDAVPDASGTDHDVPSAAECLACHAGRGNFSLGFSATQLPPDVRSDLFDAGVLTEAVDEEPQLPEAALAGLGVLHGNCSHCHNATRDDQPQATTCYAPPVDDDEEEGPLDMSLPPDLASVESAPVVLTGRWQLGEIGDSELLDRISERNLREERPSMPPLGTELVDEQGLAAIEAFIAELPPRDDRD